MIDDYNCKLEPGNRELALGACAGVGEYCWWPFPLCKYFFWVSIAGISSISSIAWLSSSSERDRCSKRWSWTANYRIRCSGKHDMLLLFLLPIYIGPFSTV